LIWSWSCSSESITRNRLQWKCQFQQCCHIYV